MKKETEVSVQLSENRRYLQECCRDCDDIILRSMKLGRDHQTECLIVYIETAVSNMMLEQSLIGKLVNQLWSLPDAEICRFLSDNSAGISDISQPITMEEALQAVLAGNAVLFVDGYDRAVKLGDKGYPGMGVTKSESEKVLRGSQEGFTDSLKVNTSLIRKRIRSSGLKVKELQMGVRTDTTLAFVYMEELIYPEILEEAKRRLERFVIDGILESGMAEQLAEANWISLFPQFQTTERPDRAAMGLLDGRIVLLCDNSPTALLLPTTLHNFLQASEDRYHRFMLVSFQRMLRYAAMLLALLLSASYLAVIRFHTQMIPVNLLLSFAQARSGVPFSSLIEVLLMELSFELIREAGVRMPGPLGGTIGIVGGLIIGDAAVSANLVSPMSVVVVALSALSSFAIPNEEFSSALRLLKFGFIILGSQMGMFGVMLGLYILMGHLSGLVSFGIPYLVPFSADSFVRAPFRMMRKRPVFARRDQKIRLRKER